MLSSHKIKQSHGRVQNRQESDILVTPQETTQTVIWKNAICYKFDHQLQITLHIPDHCKELAMPKKFKKKNRIQAQMSIFTKNDTIQHLLALTKMVFMKSSLLKVTN